MEVEPIWDNLKNLHKSPINTICETLIKMATQNDLLVIFEANRIFGTLLERHSKEKNFNILLQNVSIRNLLAECAQYVMHIRRRSEAKALPLNLRDAVQFFHVEFQANTRNLLYAIEILNGQDATIN